MLLLGQSKSFLLNLVLVFVGIVVVLQRVSEQLWVARDPWLALVDDVFDG